MGMLTVISWLVSTVLVAAVDLQSSGDSYTPRSCNSPIYCDGPLLKTVQLAQLYPDSKTFVDMPTKNPEDQVMQAFNALGQNPSVDAIQSFVNANFLDAGYELEPFNFTVEPLTWLDRVDDIIYREWLEDVHEFWTELAFNFNTAKLCDGCVSSTLPVKNPFIVPGGRFREFYYWDSFFVIQGLLLGDIDDMARNMIENFLDFVDTYGFMPNGARIYYLNRSQPPFLTQMVKLYFEKTNDVDFLKKALPVLDKEYVFWLDNTTVTIRKNGERYRLNHYNVHNESPRPESYVDDYNTVVNGTHFSLLEQVSLFSDLATGAETGWDYSSRWSKIKDYSPDLLRTLDTRSIVPVELNALLWSMETTLADWHDTYGTEDRRKTKRQGEYYRKQASQRLHAMDVLLWDEAQASFFDFNLTSVEKNSEYTPANLFPFWLGAVPERVLRSKPTLEKVFDLTYDTLAKYPGILTTSTHNTTQQWDFPNGWPPLQYVALQAMFNVDEWLGDTKFAPLAQVLAERNVATTFCSWYSTGGSLPGVLNQLPNTTDSGHIFEKFDVLSLDSAGSGGEYTVQVGFGWTNGVIIWMFDMFTNLTAPNCNSTTTYPLPPL
ncbi:trehalase [Hesseltinella vesiculosa]|uniref:Trehalase n=1 Tax=Hesseltinella vesiculosa TaxID=101127 RepID=A0A1X2GG74_9FUNG|nr:trehalase [Hesseltinella vesiculosa]